MLKAILIGQLLYWFVALPILFLAPGFVWVSLVWAFPAGLLGAFLAV